MTKKKRECLGFWKEPNLPMYAIEKKKTFPAVPKDKLLKAINKLRSSYPEIVYVKELLKELGLCEEKKE